MDLKGRNGKMSSLGGSKELMNSKYINSLLNGRWQTFPLNLKNWVRRPPRFKSHPSEECNILLGWHFMLNYLYTCIHIHRFTHEHSHSARTHTHMCILSNTSSGGNGLLYRKFGDDSPRSWKLTPLGERNYLFLSKKFVDDSLWNWKTEFNFCSFFPPKGKKEISYETVWTFDHSSLCQVSKACNCRFGDWVINAENWKLQLWSLCPKIRNCSFWGRIIISFHML